MSKKTISVNPELFSMSKKSNKSKTRKNKPLPLVSPNVMKRNLLQKIKDHKERNTRKDEEKNEDIGRFTSEFQDSMNYLKELTQNSDKFVKPIPDVPNQHQNPFVQRPRINNKSLKNPYSHNHNNL